MSRALILVDESNLTAAARGLGRRMDWEVIRSELGDRENREVVEMILYVGLPPDMPAYRDARSGKLRFAYWAQSNGFMVVTKEGVPIDPTAGTYKANVDVLMAVDAVHLAVDIRPDVVVLCSGDVDFAHLALTLRRRGIRVEVASTASSLSGQLKAAANAVVDLTSVIATMDPMVRPSDEAQAL